MTTLKSTLEKIVKRFSVRRVIAVADRGLLSTDNLNELQAIRLPGGGKLEFILAVPGRRYTDFIEILEPLHKSLCTKAKQEVVGEMAWNELRLIVAHDPSVAAETTAKRDLQIQTLQAQAAAWVGKLKFRQSK